MPWWEKENVDSEKSGGSLVFEKACIVFKFLIRNSYIAFGISIFLLYFHKNHLVGMAILGTACITMLECSFVLSAIGRRKGLYLIRYPFVAGSALIIVAACINASLLIFHGKDLIKVPVIGALVLMMLYMLFLFKIKFAYNVIPDISYTVFAFLYVTIPIALIILLAGDLLLEGGKNFAGNSGIAWLVYIVTVTKASDFGRIIGGRAFGDKGIFSYLGSEHSVESYLVSSIFGMVSSISAWYLLKAEQAHLLGIAIVTGLLFSLAAFTGSVIAEILAQDAKIGTVIGDKYSAIKDAGIFKSIGSLCITMPLAYAAIHILDFYLQ